MQDLHFEIWCRVVDNLGDAGVCWRLARQLRREHRFATTLRIDDRETLARILPPAGTEAVVDGVRILRWDETDPAGTDASGATRVLVTAFGCELPPGVRESLAPDAQAARNPALWVQLEYLSAEDWVDGCHGIASIKPTDGALEHFFYPGFTPATGGLLRERALQRERDSLQTGDAGARWLAARGLAAAPGERLISLFCYPDAPLGPWLAALAAGPAPSRVLVPPGVADDAITALLGARLPVGESARIGALAIQRYPMLDQDDFDRLLWSCDLNFVRGEDSWIRAHWARRPFVWQPYPQDPATRLIKLDAFLARFEAVAGPIPAAATLMRAWCGASGPAGGETASAPDAIELAWRAFEAGLGSLAPRYRRWSDHLAARPDLATTLVDFCRERL